MNHLQACRGTQPATRLKPGGLKSRFRGMLMALTIAAGLAGCGGGDGSNRFSDTLTGAAADRAHILAAGDLLTAAANGLQCPGTSGGNTGVQVVAGLGPTTIAVKDLTTGNLLNVVVTISGPDFTISSTTPALTSASWCWKSSLVTTSGTGTSGSSTATNKRGIKLNLGYVTVYSVTSQPVVVAASDSIIASGNSHTCAIHEGKLKCWGWNFYGQLGNGTTQNSSRAVEVPGMAGATAVSAGELFTCALRDGDVYCWGGGYGTPGTPAQMGVGVPGFPKMSHIDSGLYHTCARGVDSTVWCWGDNFYGQLGRGNNQSSGVPAQVPGIVDAVSAAAGGSTSCAVHSDGRLSCWGRNDFGALGNGSTGDSNLNWSPVHVKNSDGSGFLTGVTAASLGDHNACAIVPAMGSGAACWGFGAYGQLGTVASNPLNAYPLPATVQGITNIRSIKLSTYHTCAVAGASGGPGSVYCWGQNNQGKLGLGTDGGLVYLPLAVPGTAGASRLDLGSEFTCTMVGTASALCWGDNYYMNLGNGDESGTDSLSPVQVLFAVP